MPLVGSGGRKQPLELQGSKHVRVIGVAQVHQRRGIIGFETWGQDYGTHLQLNLASGVLVVYRSGRADIFAGSRIYPW